MASSPGPTVSIVTPTYGREKRLRLQYQTVLAQSMTDFEWLILDDSPGPSDYFSRLGDCRVRYHHRAGKQMLIGTKRNWLAEHAAAPVIAHFDDDDYYGPDYLATMLARMSEHGADVVKLSGWFLYTAVHNKLAYWNTVNTRGLHFRVAHEGIAPMMFGEAEMKTFARNYLGYGYTTVYRKSAWQKNAFPEVDFDEDFGFASGAVAKGFRLEHFADTNGICMQIMRRDGTSMAFPQYILPDFLLNRLFPPAVNDLLQA